MLVCDMSSLEHKKQKEVKAGTGLGVEVFSVRAVSQTGSFSPGGVRFETPPPPEVLLSSASLRGCPQGSVLRG